MDCHNLVPSPQKVNTRQRIAHVALSLVIGRSGPLGLQPVALERAHVILKVLKALNLKKEYEC